MSKLCIQEINLFFASSFCLEMEEILYMEFFLFFDFQPYMHVQSTILYIKVTFVKKINIKS